jgi:hypothetical protein
VGCEGRTAETQIPQIYADYTETWTLARAESATIGHHAFDLEVNTLGTHQFPRVFTPVKKPFPGRRRLGGMIPPVF